MPTYLVDPTKFFAEGALVSWPAAARRVGNPDDQPLGTVIELRWMLNAAMGLPTEPFGVWARPHSAPIAQPLNYSERQLLFFGFVSLITWTQGSMSSVSVDVQAPSGGSISAFSGGPLLSNICVTLPLATGNSTVELTAHVIDGLLISPGVTVTGVRGIGTGGYANAAGWTPVELVGLPVNLATWGGIGKHGEPQGLVGSFTAAPNAAVQRLTRGAPPTGWGPNLSPGVAAPAWAPPVFPALVQEVNAELLDALRGIAQNFPPNQQAVQLVTVSLPPPENSSGQQMGGSGSTSQLSPLNMTYMAAASDPFFNLVLGFGTAYGLQQSGTVAVSGANVNDFMITAHWEKGLDGASAPLDYAAIVPIPTLAPAPPPPANMFTELLGSLRPLIVDGNWRTSVRLSWDRPPDMQLFRTAGFAAARASIAPAQPVVALMEPRPSGGLRPITINQAANPPDPEFWRLHAVDREAEIPSNPGTRQVKYGGAVQDIYGQWTPWVTVDQTLVEPELAPVQIAAATLLPTAPSSGSVCPTTLEMDFLWDWRIRTPAQVAFVGRMYAASSHGDPPPSVSVPTGLDRSLAGGGAALQVTFSGDTPSAAGTTIIPLTESGDDQASGFGPPQGSSARRFRLTLSGLALDFGSTGFIGLALWAQGQEQIAPQRVSAWSTNPTVISTADPRPPVVPVDHVTLGSIPDASGCSHVRISWTQQPNAAGYFIYEATEAGILEANGLPEPAPSDTLDTRLQRVKQAFRTNPARRQFTRLNSTLLQTSSTDIALPRGSTGIHLYIVLGVSAGQVESKWPDGPTPDDSLIAIAAPHIMNPASPMIEVTRIFDQSTLPPVYRANILITTRPGPRPAKVEVHRVRVDDAARELDTMGPPIARVTASGGGWTVAQTPDVVYGPYISTVQGSDAPPGSWRRVWYRATAWTAQDDTRGALPGRSAASNAAWVVLPPADGPSISPLLMGGGSGPADVVVQWSSPAPVARTPLGSHDIAVRAELIGAPANTQPLLGLDSTLDQLGTSEPTTESGAWIVSTVAGNTTYRAIIRRAAITDALKFAVRITDPVGRTGTQLANIQAGPIVPPPDLENLQVQHVLSPPPGRALLTFTSSSPIQAPLDGPYVVRVTALPHIPPPIFPPPLVIEMPLGSVPTRPPVAPPPPISIMRLGTGPVHTYEVGTQGNMAGFVVRITAPTGQSVQKSAS
jgi:hypothetical protein